MKKPIRLIILIVGILLLSSSDLSSQSSNSQDSTKKLTLYELRQSVKYLTEVEYRREKDMLAQTQFKLYDSTIVNLKEQKNLLIQTNENLESIIEKIRPAFLDKAWIGGVAVAILFVFLGR